MEIQSFEDIEIFKNCKCPIKKTSRDSGSNSPEYMVNSDLEVINFDKVTAKYVRKLKPPFLPKSNDALYIGKDKKIYFVEFKNGLLKSNEVFDIYNKIYDSLLIFNDIVNTNISFCRQHLYFILVYNEDKNPQDMLSVQTQESAKVLIKKAVHRKAKQPFIRFGLDRFEKIYFKRVYTYTVREFDQKFLLPAGG